MANTEIDSLSLEIEIKGLNPEDVKNIDKLSKAVARLSRALKDADFSKLEQIKVPKGLKNIQLVTQNFREGSIINGTDFNEMEQKADEALGEIADKIDNVNDGMLAIDEATKHVKTSFYGIGKEANNLFKNASGKIDETKKKLNAIEKLLKRFKTIAFIKAIRAVLNIIVQSIKQGINNLAMFDSAFNETISKITTATTNIKNSLALITRPLVEVLQPVIENISKLFVELGNNISKAQASMKGLSQYTKISAKYMEDYANASKKAQLFSFDTFNTLDTDSNNMYETESLDEESKNNVSDIASFVEEIQGLLSNVFALLGKVFKLVTKIITYLSPALTQIFGIINDILDPVITLIGSILDALDPILKAVLSDLLPSLLKIVRDVLQPVLLIVKELTPIITLIVDLVSNILAPIIDTIAIAINGIEPILKVITTMVSFIIDLLGTGLLEVFNIILTASQPLLDAIQWIVDTFGTFMDAIHSLFNADFDGFADNIVLFFKKAFFGLLRVLASVVDSVINAIINGINLIFVPLNKLSEWFDWGWEIGISWRSNLADLVPSFANGGIVGEIWQMNEYGNPEMLYNANNSGNTSVINQAQLTMAFEQAIYNTGLIDTILKAGVINIDGRSIAQSTTFKNEINRTNPNLNLR